MSQNIQDFKNFIHQGNIIQMAVSFVMGLAFNTLINTVVDSIITPFIALVFSILGVDGSSLNLMMFSINGVNFKYGAVINVLIQFFIVSLTLFAIIKFYSTITNEDQLKDGSSKAKEVELLEEIRDSLKNNTSK